MMNKFLSALLFASIASLACHSGKIRAVGDNGGTGSSGGGGGQGGGRGNGSDTGLITPGPVFDGSAAETGTGAPGSPGNPTCAEDVKKAVQVPLALMLVVDASSSMASGTGPGAGPSKYDQVEEAMKQFVGAAGSAGLSLGLQFFPLPGSGSPCMKDADCGYQNSGGMPACVDTTICAKTLDAAGLPTACGGGTRNLQCPTGDTCVPLGRCLLSADDCTNLGQPCGGRAGDTCQGMGMTCYTADDQTCDSGPYETAAVPVVELPLGARAVGRALGRRSPSGGTPMRPAVEGAILALRNHLATHPSQRGIVVLATDGAPGSCMRNSVADVAAVLQAARTATPSVSSYVIGVATPDVGPERMALDQLATGGGTGMPFVISATERLSMRFLETLNQIRGQALPCEFTIPAPAPGTMIDFLKVNLQIKNGTADEEVLYAGSAARCDGTRGGWYYDVDPAMGTPTRILACPATCAKLKAQNEASVDLKFGCKTRTIE